MSSRQNKGPLVFGETVVYSNCRQPANPKLQKRPPGAVILFGSRKADRFVLDTVFVVDASAAPRHLIGERPDVEVPEELTLLVFDALATDPGAPRRECTVCRGATVAEPYHGCYSFVPARPFDDQDPWFERPPIDARPYVNPNLGMAARVTSASPEEAVEVWAAVRDTVLSHGLVLGVQIEMPERRLIPKAPVEQAPQRGGC